LQHIQMIKEYNTNININKYTSMVTGTFSRAL